MPNLNLKIIKFFFVVVVAMFVLSLVSGMSILRDKELFNSKKISMEMSYLKYSQNENARLPAAFNQVHADQANAKSVPVLLYHGIITDQNWEEDGTNISLENFENQMYSLKKTGYQTITIADFRRYMKGERDLPDKSILITFDDGRKDSLYQADPILRALGFRAVMFVISGRSLGSEAAGDNYYLGKAELQDMIRSERWEIQSHGDSDHDWMAISSAGETGHFMSNRLWIASENRNESQEEAKKRIIADLEESKRKLEEELGQPVFAFAYPFNDYGQGEKNFPEARNFIAENIGRIYPLTFFQEEKNEPFLNVPDQKGFMAKRINVDNSMSAEGLIRLLANSKEKELPYEDTFWSDKGWRVKFGSAKVWGDLNLGETEEGGGNLTILLGSLLWRDYSVKSRVNIVSGNSFSQVVRYENSQNFARCSFGQKGISIVQVIDGKSAEIAEVSGDFKRLLSGDGEVGTDVSGGKIVCFFNGQKMLEAFLDPTLAFGGVGYYAWDDIPESADIRVRALHVSEIQPNS
jgi:peptidoglycan/xylan/chitin deacetylase (PgdA/CDA1 family)